MKYIMYLFLSISVIACSSKSGMEEKNMATQEFINCDFYAAKSTAELALQYAGDNVAVAVPALLIIGKSSEFLNQDSSAYEKIVDLAPGVANISDAKKIANNFVQGLSKAAPEKVKDCPQLQS